MSLTAAVLKKMRELGLTLDQAIEIADAMAPSLVSEDPADRKRRLGRERQAKYAERQKASGMTSSDASSDAKESGCLPPTPPNLPKENTPPLPPTGEFPPAARKAKPEPEGFAAFWDEYPRKVGKPDALKAYAGGLGRIGEPGAPLAIITGLRRQLPGWRDRPPDRVPHPATWLNRDGWNDDPDPPRRLERHERPDHQKSRSERNMDAALAGIEILADAWRPGVGYPGSDPQPAHAGGGQDEPLRLEVGRDATRRA